MIHKTVIRQSFPVSVEKVYAALVNLDEYALWNNGMVKVEPTGTLHEGMIYTSTNIVVGRETTSRIVVSKLTPNRLVELSSDNGAIIFNIKYRVEPESTGSVIVCVVEFELSGIVLNFAHSVIESMAKARLAGDLQTLRALLTDPNRSSR